VTNNKKLIEEAAQAMANAPHAEGWAAFTENEQEWYRKDAAVALAVFEKALTPTGEERETVAVASRDTWGWDLCVACGSEDVSDRGVIVVVSKAEGVFLARLGWCDDSDECRDDLRQSGASVLTPDDAAAFDAALRHSAEVPEPSAECPQPCAHLSQHDAREGRTCTEHPCTCPEPQAEPSSEVPEPSADWDRVHNRPADIYTPPEDRIARPLPEPQAEPSDASVRAALREWFQGIIAGGWTAEHEARMRAAVRAAGDAR